MDPKEHYKQLRRLTADQLWTTQVPRFDKASAEERPKMVAIIRAVGSTLGEEATTQLKAQAREWLRVLLDDPDEKVRRYAVQALPKLGAGSVDENELLGLLQSTKSTTERKHVIDSLSKVGSKATLAALEDLDAEASLAVEQRARATVARRQAESKILADARLMNVHELRIQLRCREGLETLLEDEVLRLSGSRFTVVKQRRGLVSVSAAHSVSLEDIHQLRIFSDAAFQLGTTAPGDLAAVAKCIASEHAHELFSKLTEGPLRYRIELSDVLTKGQLKQITEGVFQARPQLLNDSREAPWQINLHEESGRWSVELQPRLRPDPRFAYRVGDVPASSHPPLAAAMARLAEAQPSDVVWDPFCGSGLELIERGLLGRLRGIYGTDLNGNAILTAQKNLKSAKVSATTTRFICCDFRRLQELAELRPGSLTLIISNPPLGRRVPVPEMRQLMQDVFAQASILLGPTGRMVLINPAPDIRIPHNMRRVYRQVVDLGGFDGTLEKYVRFESAPIVKRSPVRR
jgi:23S rRNA G2445 N2-methylase RlmL